MSRVESGAATSSSLHSSVITSDVGSSFLDDAFLASKRPDMWLADLAPMLTKTSQRLWAIWERHDFDDSMRERRKKQAVEYVRNLLEDMEKQETDMSTRLLRSIEDNRVKVAAFREELGMPDFVPIEFAPESVKLFRALESECASLSKRVEDMRGKLPTLEEEVARLKRRLGWEEGSGSSQEGNREPSPPIKTPSRQVSKLECRVMRLTRELEDRKERIRVSHKEIREKMDRMGDHSTDRDMSDVLAFNTNSDTGCISQQMVDRAEQAREAIEFKYREWKERETFAYDEIFMVVADLWDKCHIPERERTLPKRFLPEKHTHTVVDEALAEAERLKKMAEERKDVYAALKRWKRVWEQKLEHEAEDEARQDLGMKKYANRAANLFKAIKRLNHVETVALPGAKIAVATAYDEYVEGHPDDRILIGGLTPIQYMEAIESEHLMERDARRAERMAARRHEAEVKAAEARSPWHSGSSTSRIGMPSSPRRMPAYSPHYTLSKQPSRPLTSTSRLNSKFATSSPKTPRGGLHNASSSMGHLMNTSAGAAVLAGRIQKPMAPPPLPPRATMSPAYASMKRFAMTTPSFLHAPSTPSSRGPPLPPTAGRNPLYATRDGSRRPGMMTSSTTSVLRSIQNSPIRGGVVGGAKTPTSLHGASTHFRSASALQGGHYKSPSALVSGMRTPTRLAATPVVRTPRFQV